MIFKKKKRGNKFVNIQEQSQFATRRPKRKKLFIWRSRTTRLVTIGLIIVLAVLIWITFFTNIIVIKKINISETKHVPALEIEKLVWEQASMKKWLVLPQDRILFFSKKQLASKLNNNFQLKELHISKRLPSTIKINIVEKDYTLIWNEAGQFHYINNDGDIILTMDQPQENQIVIYNQGSALLQGRQIKLKPEMILFINNLNDRLNAKEIVKVQEYIVDDDLDTVKLKEERGPLVFFSTNNDIDKQVTKLETLITELEDAYDQQHYIDLRFGDRIFYQ
ncbi:MAG: hypothetical protein V1865_02430 [bacterium]